MTSSPSAPYDPVEAVADALRSAGCHVQRAGRGYSAQCPAHDDRDPSLSVGRGTSGEPKAVLYCHAGCGVADVLDALGLPPAALFADYRPDDVAKVYHLHHLRPWHPSQGPKQQPRRPPPYRREKDAHFDYVWPDGSPAARVVKFLKVDPDTGEIVGKTFAQQRWDTASGTYLNGLDGMDVPLYHADRVAAAVAAGLPVVVCEGEKDADAAADSWGVTATTNPMGAGSWRPHHSLALAGASVVLIADDDPPGHQHATAVADALAGVARTVAVMVPTRGGDVAEHIANGGAVGDLRPLHPAEASAAADEQRAAVRAVFPALDWHALWADDSEEEWILEPLLPARRLVALYSAPKVGKSLLMLELAVGVCRGALLLGYQVPRPFRVLYVDFENDPKGDVRARLQAMGYGPDDLGNLHYLSFPTLAALDSPEGGEQLLAAVDAYGAEVVVIDTVSRAVRGDENANDTWLGFYRHTGLALKQAGVALIRLDHSGKDELKGQRGGSAKSGDVDAVWRLRKETETVLSLECDAARVPIPVGERHIVLERVTEPRLRHVVKAAGAASLGKVHRDDLVKWLDENGYPDGLSVRDSAAALRDAGHRFTDGILRQACRERRQRVGAWEPDEDDE